MNSNLFPKISQLVAKLDEIEIPKNRIKILDSAVDAIQQKVNMNQEVKLNFICTHNSRRSQFSEIWAKTIASFYAISIDSYSGGMEVTAFHSNAIAALVSQGFEIEREGGGNPVCNITFSFVHPPQRMFSKLITDATNPTNGFIAFMTCDHASDNCPLVLGADQRIELPFEDPKRYDGDENALHHYAYTSLLIASEMNYIFSRIHIKNG